MLIFSFLLTVQEQMPTTINSNDIDFSIEIDLAGLKEDLAHLQKDAIIARALSEGIDLRMYANKLEGELRTAANVRFSIHIALFSNFKEDAAIDTYLFIVVFAHSQNSVDSYVSESENFANLHEEVIGCDETLTEMQKFLNDFQEKLDGIGSDIKELHENSARTNGHLKQRRAAGVRQ